MARIDREQLGELLSGYIDDELDAAEREVIERVLREDESARQLLADLQQTTQAVAALPRHAAPAAILGDTQATLERLALLNDFPEPQAHQTRGRSSWAARLAMAAMVGLVVGTGWWFTTEQTRRGSTGKTELAQREVRVVAPTSVSTDSRVALERRGDELAVSDAARSAGAAIATVEQHLRAGVDPTSFRNQTFAAESVRLQVMVRDQTQRETVTTRIATALSSQHLVDLASAPGGRTDTTGTVQNFYYRGKAGLNFEAAHEDQILVRASPQQIDSLLAGLSEPNQPEEAVAMVAGPITVQGVEKSRNVVQLLGDQQRSSVPRSAMTRGDESSFDENGTTLDADRTSVDQPTATSGGMIGGLLKIVGIDPNLLSSEARPLANSGGPSVETGAKDSTEETADETSVVVAKESAISQKVEAKNKTTVSADTQGARQPPVPPPLVERRLRVATQSSRESDQRVEPTNRAEPTGATIEASVTLIIQIIESPSPAQSPKLPTTKPEPPSARKPAE